MKIVHFFLSVENQNLSDSENALTFQLLGAVFGFTEISADTAGVGQPYELTAEVTSSVTRATS